MKIKLKSLSIIVVLFFSLFDVKGQSIPQKPVIDEEACTKWSYLGNKSRLTQNGTYLMYERFDGLKNVLVFQALDGKWMHEIKGGLFLSNDSPYSSDGRTAIFKTLDGKLGILKLGTEDVRYIAENYSTAELHTSRNWLIYRDKTETLNLFNLITRTIRTISKVKDFVLAKNGNKIAFLKDTTNGKKQVQLYLTDLKNTVNELIWSGEDIENLVLDKKGTSAAFIGSDLKGKSIWYYSSISKTIKSINPIIEGKNAQGKAFEINRFTHDNQGLIINWDFNVHKTVEVDFRSNFKLNIWHYTYPYLKHEQEAMENQPTFLSILKLRTQELIPIESKDESLGGIQSDNDNVQLLDNRSSKTLQSLFLVNQNKRVLLEDLGIAPNKSNAHWTACLSRNGKYLISYDKNKKGIISRNLETNKIAQVAHDSNANWKKNEDGIDTYYTAFAWLKSGDEAIFKDVFGDLWKVWLNGAHAPVLLTNGYFQKNNIAVDLMPDMSSSAGLELKPMFLYGFDNNAKLYRYYWCEMKINKDPILLANDKTLNYGVAEKASEAKKYVLQIGNAANTPNYFSTSDFKVFHPVSRVYPEKSYNWLTAELLSWKVDSSYTHAVLYKPENFDVSKKYPVIFYYYETLSGEFGLYTKPSAISRAIINIPWYVSRGYLVCTVDIKYTIGDPGYSALKYINAAADHVSRMPYVDNSKMGIQGHSFGGYETLFVVTHSKRFAAAMAGAGVADLVSSYSSVWDNGYGRPKTYSFEKGQLRMGKSLWQDQDAYLRNSPILSLDKVVTPLLMMHNRQDNAVDFAQSLGFFMGMKRLGKPAWMLEYEKQGHVLMSDSAAIDLRLRTEQFFDHYLKDKPAPLWMTRGVPFSERENVEKYLQLNTSGKTP